MSQDVKPTRSEELRLKEKIELAEDGHDILEKKRDGLIHEFMQVVDDARDTNQELADLYTRSMNRIQRAEALDGSSVVRSTASRIRSEPTITSREQNIMGVVVPEIESIDVQRTVLDRNYPVTSSTAHTDSAADSFEELLEKVVQAAETQTKILKLLEEIEKTKRRVNALEHNTIPEMKDAKSYISQTLREEAREETFRMKKIKEMQED